MTEEEEAAREKLAAELVTEAFEGFDHVLTPDLAELIRALLQAELLTTAAGQETLRSVAAALAVAASETVARDGAQEDRVAEPGKSKSG